ncbi:hypothetical protein V6Z12_D11G322700 [Gossypium hirsutum]
MLLVHLPISVRSIIFSFQIFVFFFKTISIYHQQTLINLFLPSHTLLISLPPHFRFNLVLLPFHLRLVLPPLQGPLRPESPSIITLSHFMSMTSWRAFRHATASASKADDIRW